MGVEWSGGLRVGLWDGYELGWACGDGKMLYCYSAEEQISPHVRSSCMSLPQDYSLELNNKMQLAITSRYRVFLNGSAHAVQITTLPSTPLVLNFRTTPPLAS